MGILLHWLGTDTKIELAVFFQSFPRHDLLAISVLERTLVRGSLDFFDCVALQ
jgi:hypothetical protein